MTRLDRFVVAVALILLHSLPSSAVSGPFRAGAFAVDISPTNYPVLVNAMFTERTATKAVDPLSARALVLDDGTNRLALVVVDTCMMPRDLIDRAKDQASRVTGIPTDRMLVSATHTHSAPSAMGCLGSRVDTNYAAFLAPQLAKAIVGAVSNLTAARIGWSVVDDWEHTFNRRWIRRPDRLLTDPFGDRNVRANMHPGHESPDAIGPSGPVDPGLTILSVQALDGRPLALLANYSQHYYGSELLSSDYYGRFREHIARLLGATNSAFVGIMSQGTSGDQMWMDYGAPRQEIGYDAYAQQIAAKAFAAYEKIQYHDWVPLRMAERKITLKFRAPDADRLVWARQMASRLGDRLPQSQPEIYALEALYLHARPTAELKIQALRIGELGIAAIPNEVYAITGLKVKQQSPLQPSFTMELANGAEGYIPPPEQHVLGGYTTWPARTAGLEPAAEPRIVDTVLDLLEEVSGRSRRPIQDQHGPYALAILKDKPTAYWRFNEIGGARPIRQAQGRQEPRPTEVTGVLEAYDASGHEHHATYENGVALYLAGPGSGEGVSPKPALHASNFSGDAINRAVHFCGGRVRGEIKGLPGTYSVELWFWNGMQPEGQRRYLFSRSLQNAFKVGGDYLGLTGNSNAPARLFVSRDSKGDGALTGRTDLPLRTWTHLVFVRDGNQVAVYLNGKTTPEINGELTPPGELGAQLCVGGSTDQQANFEGKIDEVALFDRALTAQGTAQHYQAAQPASLPCSPQESLNKLHVRPGFVAELVAAEPMVIDPVAIDWDAAGRLWVVEMADYPLGLDGEGKAGGRIRVLEDRDSDGHYDHSTLFAQDLSFPTGLMTWRDGVLVTAAPDILFLKDSDGDGRADVREVLYSGFTEGNQQLRVNGLRWGLDNWIYCASGGHHPGYGTETQITSTRSGQKLNLGSRDFRIRPDVGAIDPQSGPTQFGRDRDNWGHWFGTQNVQPIWHYVLADHYLRRNPHVTALVSVKNLLTPGNPKLYPASDPEKRYHSFDEAGHFTSACSGMIYRDEFLFSGSTNRHAFVCEPFHNLVHHRILTDQDVSFTSERDPAETASEFLASEDRWFRPVMVRTGPDGALWVVDMYRYMIEHPEWLPENGKADLKPHYRAGDDKGRIYRIYPADKVARAMPRLDKLSPSELVATLRSPNGWQRDKAQQLLLWRSDQSAMPLLATLAKEQSAPVARIHALWTLHGLGSFDPGLIEQALSDPHPEVRRNALQLAESHPVSSVLDVATKLTSDPDPKVRFQLACSLGEWKETAAGEALGRLAVDHPDDRNLAAAILSSAAPHCSILTEAVVKSGEPALRLWFQPLLDLALGLKDRGALAKLLQPIFTAGTKDAYNLEQLDRFGLLLDTLDKRSITLQRLMTPKDSLGSELQLSAAIFASALTTAADGSRPPSDRVRAAGVLVRDAAYRPKALPLLAGWLTPLFSTEVQSAAVQALIRSGDATVPALLLKHWQEDSPQTRSLILDGLMTRESWILEMLRAEGPLNASAFDPARRTRLLRHRSEEVRRLAARVFETSGASSRAGVVQSFQPALRLEGDAQRGAALHARLCASCHPLDSRGPEVGPNLRSVAEQPPEKLLVNVLDPNAAVEPRYVAYYCDLTGGEELYGLIEEETATSLTMKLLNGSTRSFLRSEISSIRGTSVSLMPEGLEAGLNPQDLADLIRFLRVLKN